MDNINEHKLGGPEEYFKKNKTYFEEKYFTKFNLPEEKGIESFVPQLTADPKEWIPEIVVDLRVDGDFLDLNFVDLMDDLKMNTQGIIDCELCVHQFIQLLQ